MNCRASFFLEDGMNTIKKICIDPGHGGDDNGAAWGHAEEDDINLSVAYLLRCELEKRGVDVVMTREADVYVALADRCMIANKAHSDYFVSIHCDAFHKETASGISTHVFRGASDVSMALAERVQGAMLKRFPGHLNRGVKLAGFCVLRHTLMPAVLVECEFISNPDTRKFLREPENQLAIARAIAGAI